MHPAQAAMHLHRSIIFAITLQLSLLLLTLMRLILRYHMKEPYHTSILSGYAWLHELLHGHPEHIRTELGVHKEVFHTLIERLRSMGHGDTRYVTTRGTACHLSLYISHWLIYTSCWRAISACKWDNFQVSIVIIGDDSLLNTNLITDTFEK
jgi:hypothetical protein